MIFKKKKTKSSNKNIFVKSSEINFKNSINTINSIGYITSILASCASIPHSNTKKTFFKRSNGNISLKIISDPEYGLPYGIIPRIIMIWLCTEAKLTNSSELYLGKTQNEFIKKLGMSPTGGKYGSINRIKKQMIRLFHSTFSLTYSYNSIHKFSNLTIVDHGFFSWNKKKFFRNKIKLSDKFYREIKYTSLPIDLKVIKVMRSPLAIDIYIWLTWRLRIINIKKGIFISWQNLKYQFGSNYSNSNKGLSNFKIEFIKKLNCVCFFYTNINITILDFGLKLKNSYPHIPYLNCK